MWRTPATRKHPRKPITPHGNRRMQAREKLLAKRRRLRIAFFAFASIFIALCVWGLSTLSYLQTFAVTQTNISGTRTLSISSLTHTIDTYTASAYGGLFSKQNIALYPRNELAQTLSYTFPKIKTIDIHRTGVHTVDIAISERVAYAKWCMPIINETIEEIEDEPTPCFYLDETGFIFQEAPTEETKTLPTLIATLPTDTILRTAIAQSNFARIVQLIASVEHETELLVQKINIAENELTLTVEPNWELKIHLDDTAEFLPSFKAILDTDGLRARINELEYIDMRFGERVYYKLRL